MQGSPTFVRVRAPTQSISEELKDLVQSNLLLCSERQQLFAERLASLSSCSCSVDFSTGTLSFGEEEFVIKNIQILGSFSNITKTWIWSWSSSTDFVYPEEVLEDALDAKEFGERHEIPEYVNEGHIPMDRAMALALAMTAVDVVGAEAFYPADINDGDGIAFISLRDERLFLPPAKDWSSFMINFPQLLTNAIDTYPGFIPDEMKMIEDYCMARGEEDWKFDRYDHLPTEIVQHMEIDPDITICQTCIIKDAENNRICTLIFDSDNCIRNIQINLKQQEEITDVTRQFDFPVR